MDNRLVEGVSKQHGCRWKLFSVSPGNPIHHGWVSVLMSSLLAFSLCYFARKPLAPKVAQKQPSPEVFGICLPCTYYNEGSSHRAVNFYPGVRF